MSPMSWYGGSQITERSSGVNPVSVSMTCELWIRFPWETITPLGFPVEPDVYWRKATVSHPISGSVHRSAAASSTLPVATQRMGPSSGISAASLSASAATSGVVRTRVGPQSAMMLCRRGVGLLRRGG